VATSLSRRGTLSTWASSWRERRQGGSGNARAGAPVYRPRRPHQFSVYGIAAAPACAKPPAGVQTDTTEYTLGKETL